MHEMHFEMPSAKWRLSYLYRGVIKHGVTAVIVHYIFGY